MFLLIPNPLLTLRGNIYRINDHPVVEPDNGGNGLYGAFVPVRERASAIPDKSKRIA